MKPFKIEIKWALLFAAMTLIWMGIERISGLHDTHIQLHPILTNLIAIPAITIYVLALRDKKINYYRGKMTFQQGFTTGIYITLIVTLLTPLTLIISLKLITPHFFENAISYSVNHGLLTLEAAEDYFNMKSYMSQSIVGALGMGILTSAITAAFARSKN